MGSPSYFALAQWLSKRKVAHRYATSFFRMTVNIGAMAMQLAGTKMKLVEDIRSEIAAEKMIPISIDDPRIAGL